MKGGNKLLARVRHPRLRLIDYVLRRKIIISPITPFDCAKGGKTTWEHRHRRVCNKAIEDHRRKISLVNVSNVLNEFINGSFWWMRHIETKNNIFVNLVPRSFHQCLFSYSFTQFNRINFLTFVCPIIIYRLIDVSLYTYHFKAKNFLINFFSYYNSLDVDENHILSYFSFFHPPMRSKVCDLSSLFPPWSKFSFAQFGFHKGHMKKKNSKDGIR